MSTQYLIMSPRLQELDRELQAGNSQALESFWQETESKGTPLYEDYTKDEDKALVTFLWKAEGEMKNIVVLSRIGGISKLEDQQMRRLAESNLWYKSYVVPKGLRTSYELSPNDSLISFEEAEDWKERTKTWQTDPLNSNVILFPKNEEIPGEGDEMQYSLLESPDAKEQSWITPRPEVPRGKVEKFRLRSKGLKNQRRVWVYTPPGYNGDAKEPYPFMLLFDGWAYLNLVPTPTIMDNLIAEGVIPPMVVLLPDSLDQATRNLELPCHQPFLKFLTKELLPWAHEKYCLSTDPSQNVVAGSSYGGLASFFVAMKHPELFGKVLSQSGAFWWSPEKDEYYEWIRRELEKRKTLPLEFYFDAGLLENDSPPGDEERPSLLVSNQRMRDVLEEKEYSYHYVEFSGGHDYACWKGTLADGLIYLYKKQA